MTNLQHKRWGRLASRMLKSAITLRGVTYQQLSVRLKALGIDESVSSISTKLSRGTFSAAFFLQVLNAIDVKYVDIPRLDTYHGGSEREGDG